MQTYYQPVLSSDGLYAIHEIIKDGDELLSVSFEPVRLQAPSLGELDHMLRQIHRQMHQVEPITDDELDGLLYSTDAVLDTEDKDSNVIDLVEYFSGKR